MASDASWSNLVQRRRAAGTVASGGYSYSVNPNNIVSSDVTGVNQVAVSGGVGSVKFIPEAPKPATTPTMTREEFLAGPNAQPQSTSANEVSNAISMSIREDTPYSIYSRPQPYVAEEPTKTVPTAPRTISGEETISKNPEYAADPQIFYDFKRYEPTNAQADVNVRKEPESNAFQEFGAVFPNTVSSYWDYTKSVGEEIGFKNYNPESGIGPKQYDFDAGYRKVGVDVAGVAAPIVVGFAKDPWTFAGSTAVGIVNAALENPGRFVGETVLFTAGTKLASAPLKLGWNAYTNHLKLAEAEIVTNMEIYGSTSRPSSTALMVVSKNIDPGVPDVELRVPVVEVRGLQASSVSDSQSFKGIGSVDYGERGTLSARELPEPYDYYKLSVREDVKTRYKPYVEVAGPKDVTLYPSPERAARNGVVNIPASKFNQLLGDLKPGEIKAVKGPSNLGVDAVGRISMTSASVEGRHFTFSEGSDGLGLKQITDKGGRMKPKPDSLEDLRFRLEMDVKKSLPGVGREIKSRMVAGGFEFDIYGIKPSGERVALGTIFKPFPSDFKVKIAPPIPKREKPVKQSSNELGSVSSGRQSVVLETPKLEQPKQEVKTELKPLTESKNKRRRKSPFEENNGGSPYDGKVFVIDSERPISFEISKPDLRYGGRFGLLTPSLSSPRNDVREMRASLPRQGVKPNIKTSVASFVTTSSESMQGQGVGQLREQRQTSGQSVESMSLNPQVDQLKFDFNNPMPKFETPRERPKPEKPDFKPSLFKGGNKSYNVELRSRGSFKEIGRGLSFEKAVDLGKSRVSNTAAASFRITSQGKIVSPGSLGGQFYLKGGVAIEKAQYRIKTPGEKSEITLKGISASRRSKL